MVTFCIVYVESFHIRNFKTIVEKNLVDENSKVGHSSCIFLALLDMNQWEHFSGDGRSNLHCHLNYLKCDCLAPDLSTSFIFLFKRT